MWDLDYTLRVVVILLHSMCRVSLRPYFPTLPSCMTSYSRLLSRVTGALLLAGCAALLSLPSAVAQSDEVPSATQTVAITNARVVQAPGQVLDRATVVVRNGLIDAVGDVEPPFDARIIEGDSLIIYAGFIDGLSHVGIDMPEDEDPEEGSYAEAGIQPERAVRPLLDPGNVEKHRKAGFGLAHVAPEGQMLPGEGALILLAGDAPDDMILTDRASLFAQIESAEGNWPNVVSPSTPMAVIAKMRDLVRETRRRMMLAEAYADDPSGRSRPPSDAVHAALEPAVDGDLPMTFYAENSLDTHRILALAEELDLPIMLAGLGDAFETLEAVAAADVPLFLTLDLPEPPDDPEADTTAADTTAADTTAEDTPPRAMTPDDPGSFFESDVRVRSQDDAEAEETALKTRQQAVLEHYFGTAATLHEAGLRFGFTTVEASAGDVHENLRTMIEHGLPADIALAALTTHAAEILGVDEQFGTVESGKVANLVVTNGELFDEDTDIQYVFVDGRRFEYASADEEGEVTASVSALVGTWAYEIETPQSTLSGTIELEGDDSGLSGTISSPQGDEPEDLRNISFDGTTLSFSFDGGDAGEVDVTVDVEEDSFDGSVNIASFGSFPITGSKSTSPDG